MIRGQSRVWTTAAVKSFTTEGTHISTLTKHTAPPLLKPLFWTVNESLTHPQPTFPEHIVLFLARQ